MNADDSERELIERALARRYPVLHGPRGLHDPHNMVTLSNGERGGEGNIDIHQE